MSKTVNQKARVTASHNKPKKVSKKTTRRERVDNYINSLNAIEFFKPFISLNEIKKKSVKEAQMISIFSLLDNLNREELTFYGTILDFSFEAYPKYKDKFPDFEEEDVKTLSILMAIYNLSSMILRKVKLSPIMLDINENSDLNLDPIEFQTKTDSLVDKLFIELTEKLKESK
jgi:predicted hydrolase (HD superfamily)